MELKRVRVKDIMIPLEKYPYIHDSQTLAEAVRLLENSQIEVHGRKSLPRMILILDRNNTLVGAARRRDLLRGLQPDFAVSKPLSRQKGFMGLDLDPNLYEMLYDRLQKGILDLGQRPVRDVMLPVEVAIDEEDHIAKAIYLMVHADLSLLPVICDNRVAGVVRSVDVFEEVARLFDGPHDAKAAEEDN